MAVHLGFSVQEGRTSLGAVSVLSMPQHAKSNPSTVGQQSLPGCNSPAQAGCAEHKAEFEVEDDDESTGVAVVTVRSSTEPVTLTEFEAGVAVAGALVTRMPTVAVGSSPPIVLEDTITGASVKMRVSVGTNPPPASITPSI